LVDTTVQEKNITYPTDVKLQKRIIEKCRKIAGKERIKLRQSYKMEMKQLMIEQRFHNHPKRKKKALAAARRIKVIAGRVVRDLERKMDTKQRVKYSNEMNVFGKVLTQTKNAKGKIYSIHQPHVLCIAKGKEAKKYEFGNKSSIVKTVKSGIIVGAMAFHENLFDGDTLEPQLAQVERLTNNKPQIGIVDRGYRGRKNVNGTQIVLPHKLPETATRYMRQKIRKWFRARAGIEPIIGHVKHEHRMGRNYLRDPIGDSINTILAAAGFNLRKMLRRLKAGAKYIYELILNWILTRQGNHEYQLI
jgi:transposase, IS5 family